MPPRGKWRLRKAMQMIFDKTLLFYGRIIVKMAL